MEPRCAVCGETETVNLYTFNYGMCAAFCAAARNCPTFSDGWGGMKQAVRNAVLPFYRNNL